MNNQQYFQTTSLSYRLKAAQRELDAFRSGEAYVKLRKDYENIIRSLNTEIKKLQHERDAVSFSRKEITRQWMCWRMFKKNKKERPPAPSAQTCETG